MNTVTLCINERYNVFMMALMVDAKRPVSIFRAIYLSESFNPCFRGFLVNFLVLFFIARP